MKKIYASWEDVVCYIEKVSQIIKKSKKKYKGIFTFPRGGLVLGVMLSHELDIPMLANPCDDCIIIDDIYDRGITLKKYIDLKKNHNYFITTMYIKEKALDYKKLDYYCYDAETVKNWVMFPWEVLRAPKN